MSFLLAILKKGLILISFKEIEKWLTPLPNTAENKGNANVETTNTFPSKLQHTKEILIASNRKSSHYRTYKKEFLCVGGTRKWDVR